MDDIRIRKIGKLSFKPAAFEGKESISTDINKNDRRGIYVYEFTNGAWYVGKSTNVITRHVGHLHEYKHATPPLIIKTMYWASLSGVNDQGLDFAETQAISHFEKEGYQLQNVLKTGRPKGDIEVVVDVGGGYGIPIPWERTQLPISKNQYIYEDEPRMQQKFGKLKSHPQYETLRKLLSEYVHKTIPAPSDTAGLLWVATAVPSGADRLCCISCQNAETLVIADNEGDLCGFINIKRSYKGKLPYPWRLRKGDYATLPNSYQLHFNNIPQSQDKYLQNEVVLDCSYRTNAELMRRGATMYRRFNNPYLVNAILED